MQPDYTSSSHWPGLSQNWLYPPITSSPYFSMPPGLHPGSMKNTSRFSEQMFRDPPGDKPAPLSPHLNPGLSPTYPPSSYPFPTRGNSYYPARNPPRRDVLQTDPYRLAERGEVNPCFNQMLERNVELSSENPSRLEAVKTPRTMDDKAIVRPQRGRAVFSAHQLNELENAFVIDQYISGQQRRRLSSQLGLTETQVRVWFQNRRIKWRKNKMERKMRP
ncbi:hypothetical protein ACROYT_G004561 [Oculina patagonica]